MTCEQTLRDGRKGSLMGILETILQAEGTKNSKARRLDHAEGAQVA